MAPSAEHGGQHGGKIHEKSRKSRFLNIPTFLVGFFMKQCHFVESRTSLVNGKTQVKRKVGHFSKSSEY